MAKLSQNSLVEMMNIAKQFGLFEAVFPGHGPLVSSSEMRKYLYARDFPTTILDELDRMNWQFDEILPAIHNGTFGLQRNLNWRDRAERISENIVESEGLLLNLATAFLLKADDFNKRSVYGPTIRPLELLDSLRRDGFILSANKLVVETGPIDVPAQLTAFQQVIADSKHDDKQLVRHHLAEAERFQTNKQWGAAASEWRHLFEESVRGAWRFTRENNFDLSNRIVKPPFRDVLSWLQVAGFLSSEEKDAYGAAFGFLSIGTHPGIKEEQLAYLSHTLALPLAHACLTKLCSWNGGFFVGFTT